MKARFPLSESHPIRYHVFNGNKTEIAISSLVDVNKRSKDRLQMGCVLRSKRKPDVAPNRPHQLFWHTIILLKLMLYDEKGAYLQMSN